MLPTPIVRLIVDTCAPSSTFSVPVLPSSRPTLISASKPFIAIADPAPVTVAVPVAAVPLRPPMFSVVARPSATVDCALPFIISWAPALIISVPLVVAGLS